MPYITYYKKNKITKKALDFEAILDLIDEIVQEKPSKEKYTYYKKEKTDVSRQLRYQIEVLASSIRQYNHFLYPTDTKKDNFQIFNIPKATGGVRTIKAPIGALKASYTHVAYDIQNKLEVLTHEHAFAYTKEKSTLKAVQLHQRNNSNWFLKIDLTKFFDRFTESVIREQLSKVHPFCTSNQLIKELAEFAVLEDQLPQGTPLSPLLTNIMMIPFDHQFNVWCEQQGFIYTRYADDIIVSHKDPFKFQTVIDKVNSILEKENYNQEINPKKTRYGNKNGNNWNLGLMLNKDNKITLGHKYKQKLKVILYKLSEGDLPQQDPKLIGLFSYLKQIEPIYYDGLNDYAIKHYRIDIKNLLG